MTAKITFHRGGGWMDRFRAYRLSVTGEEVGHIKRDSQLSVEVEATQHTLRATIDWCASNILYVDLSAGGEVHVEVSNPNGPFKGQRVMRRARTCSCGCWRRPKATNPLDCHGRAGYSAPRRQGGTAAEH